MSTKFKMKLFLCSTLMVATQANFFRHALKSHRVPHFLGAGQNHTTNKFHAVFQIVHDSDLANTEVEYFDCGTNDASTCLNGNAFHTVTNLSPTTVDADTAVTNVKDTNNNVYNLEYTPTVPKNHIITKLELNLHTIIEESYLCAAGHVPKLSVAGCDPCTAGKYAERGANSCSNCAAGKDSSAGAYAQSQCSNCAAGKYNPTAGNACQDCAAGKDSTGGAYAQSQCSNCAAGKYNPTAGNACQDCGTGKFLAAGVNIAASNCTDCTAGKYNDVAAAASCQNCDPDSTSTGASYTGYQDATGQTSCKACSIISSGYYVTTANKCSAAADRSQTQCGTAGSGACSGTYTACSNGSPITGGGADESCSGGSGGSDGSSGSSSWTCTCTNGQAGTGSSSGCTTCTRCNAGYGSTTCQQCAAGKFADGTSIAACSDCTAGKYQNLQGQSSCKNCGTGKFLAAGVNIAASSCTNCTAGKYNDQDALGSCKDCAAGHQTEDASGVANSGATKCEDCVAGKTDHDSSSSTACDDCVAGKYEANLQGTGACDDCDVGKYSAETGATASTTCLDCNAGPNTGLTTETTGSDDQSDCVFAVTMYGYVHANLTGTCQDECVEWHGQLEDNFNANDVNQLNATGADQALCNLLKNTGEMIKQQGCTACVNQANCAVSTVNTCSTTASFTTNTICTSVTADGYYLDGEVVKTCAAVADSSSRTCNGADVAGIQTVTCSSGYHETGSAGNNLACTLTLTLL